MWKANCLFQQIAPPTDTKKKHPVKQTHKKPILCCISRRIVALSGGFESFLLVLSIRSLFYVSHKWKSTNNNLYLANKSLENLKLSTANIANNGKLARVCFAPIFVWVGGCFCLGWFFNDFLGINEVEHKATDTKWCAFKSEKKTIDSNWLGFFHPLRMVECCLY